MVHMCRILSNYREENFGEPLVVCQNFLPSKFCLVQYTEQPDCKMSAPGQSIYCHTKLVTRTAELSVNVWLRLATTILAEFSLKNHSVFFGYMLELQAPHPEKAVTWSKHLHIKKHKITKVSW